MAFRLKRNGINVTFYIRALLKLQKNSKYFIWICFPNYAVFKKAVCLYLAVLYLLVVGSNM